MLKTDQEGKESDWRELLRLFRSIKDPALQEELFELFFMTDAETLFFVNDDEA